MSRLTSKIKDSVVRNWLDGAIDGTIGGFTIGTLFSLGNGENFGTALENGGNNAIQGFVIGGMNGINKGIYQNRELKQRYRINSEGYKTFKVFKKVYGRAGDGMEWHHIVEQRQANLDKFGPEQIHNVDNLVKIPSALHRKISGYYSSKQSFTEGVTVREWLNGKSYVEQFEFGLSVLKKFGY